MAAWIMEIVRFLFVHVFFLFYFLKGDNKIQFLCFGITGNIQKHLEIIQKRNKKINHFIISFSELYSPTEAPHTRFLLRRVFYFLIHRLIFHKTGNETKPFYVFVSHWLRSSIQQIANIAISSTVLIMKFETPIPVPARSKECLCSRFSAGIVGSSPAGGHGYLSRVGVACCQVEVPREGLITGPEESCRLWYVVVCVGVI